MSAIQEESAEDQEEIVTTQQIAQDFPIIVLQSCMKCGIMVKTAPFGTHTVEEWIDIFQGYLTEGIVCANCEKE